MLETYYSAFSGIINTIASAYSTSVKKGRLLCKVRGYART